MAKQIRSGKLEARKLVLDLHGILAMPWMHVQNNCTAKRILERLGIQTSSSFVKI